MANSLNDGNPVGRLGGRFLTNHEHDPDLV
jgi:hypothetical protein